MILFDDAAIIPFIESVSVSDYSSQKYNTGHSALALRPRSGVCRHDDDVNMPRDVREESFSNEIAITLKSTLWSLYF